MLLLTAYTDLGHKTLRISLGSEKFSLMVPHKYENFPYLESNELVKLEAYALCYESLTITIKANGQIEFYQGEQCLKQNVMNQCQVQLDAGIQTITCYIRPSTPTLSFELTPNIFVLNNGLIRFADPIAVRNKLMNFRFVNPDEYSRQKYYLRTKQLKTFYHDYDYLDDKYTDTTVIVPPEDEE